MSNLRIDINDFFDDEDFNVPAIEADTVEGAIRQKLDDGVKHHEIACYEMLDTDSRAAVDARAAEWYLKMREDQSLIMTWGETAVNNLNELHRKLLTEIDPIDIPEITQLMEELSNEMDGLEEFDISRDDIRKKLEDAAQGTRRRFGRFQKETKNFVRELLAKARGLQGQIELVHTELDDKKRKMIADSKMYGELYKANQHEIRKLIMVIATLERIIHEAEEDMREEDISRDLVDVNIDPGSDEVAELAEFIQQVKLQARAYRDRLVLGWATGPEIRRSQHAIAALAQSINSLMKLTVPAMEGTVVRWVALAQAKQAGRLKEVVSNQANKWVVRGAEAAEKNVVEVTRSAHAPIILSETIDKLRELMQSQDQGLLKVLRDADEEMKASHDSMYKTRLAIQQANIEQAEATIDDELIERASRLSRGSEE